MCERPVSGDGTRPDLAAFVRACLDDYEAQARQAVRDGAARVDGVTYWVGHKELHFTPAELLRFVAAWRQIVEHVAAAYHGEPGEFPPVLLRFARSHRDQPDCNEEWLLAMPLKPEPWRPEIRLS